MLDILIQSQKNQLDLTAAEFSILNYFDVHNTSSIQEIRRNIRKGLRGLRNMPEVYYHIVQENPKLIDHDKS